MGLWEGLWQQYGKITSFSKNGEDAKGQKDKNGDKPYTDIPLFWDIPISSLP